MDVVKSNIERIGGTLDVQTRKGAGTTIKIAIPLTLAIIPALLVTSGGECYAIPQASVVEMVRLSDRLEGQIEHVGEASFYRLRSELLQFVSVEDGLRPNTPGSPHSRSEQAAFGRVMIVLQERGRRFGLLVDEVDDTQEIVVRSIGKHLKHIPVYAGATILGDGRVALILDVPGLARCACPASERESSVQLIQPRELSERIVESEPLLIFEHGEGQRFALPISGISRLAQLPQSHIEKAGARRLVRFDGDILPVFGISGSLSGVPPLHGRADANGTVGENIDFIVCQHRGHSLALAVDHIVDIVDEGVMDVDGSGTHGDSAPRIIGGQVTTVLDLEELCTRANSVMSQSALLPEDGERRA
jgi:two-component system chemotaxis sensor kinase CheA